MPRISEFYGIVIAMYYDEHEPPHFHVVYGGHKAVVGINPVQMIRGNLPRRAESLVYEWVAMHQQELLENWQRARAHLALHIIAPLD